MKTALQAELIAKQVIAHYLDMCNPLVPGDTSRLPTKIIGVTQRQIEALSNAASRRDQSETTKSDPVSKN